MEMYLNFPGSFNPQQHKRQQSGNAFSPSIVPSPPLTASSPTGSVDSGYASSPPYSLFATKPTLSKQRLSRHNPSSSSSRSISPESEVMFSTCPNCKLLEHHFEAETRVCGRCGTLRYLNGTGPAAPSRTYWRPTQYTNCILYAHVRSGAEEMDSAVHDQLASWANSQRSYFVSYAQQVAQMAAGSPEMLAFAVDLQRTQSYPGAAPSSTPKFAVVSQSLMSMSSLRADDLLGCFSVLETEHNTFRQSGGLGTVVAVIRCQETAIAVGIRLDTGSF